MLEMRDCGIAWINEIPQNWEMKKIKYTLQSRNENNNPIRSTNILSLTAKQGVVPLEEKEGGGNKPKEDYSAYRLAYPGDIVMNSMNILSGSVGLSKYFGCVSPVYYMLRPILKKDDVRYFNYIFQTTMFQKSLLGLGNGILMKESENGKLNTIRMRIPLDKLGDLYIPVPDSETQKCIANYLDIKCPEIDRLLKDIEQQIDILEEYKKSVVNEVVTKGLNQNIEMQESGIEYIGLIPKGWTINKLKYILKERNERSTTGEEELLSVSQYKGVIPSSELSQRTMQANSLVGYKKVYKEDLVFNKLNPGLARFGCSNYEGITSPDFSVYAVDDNICHAKFLQYILKSDMYVTKIKSEGAGIGDGFARLYTPQLFEFKVALPDRETISIIIKYLEDKCSEIDAIITDKQKQIEILQEYKKTIIYEYVTGKKEVPV